MQFSDNTLLIVGGVFVAVILLIAITMSGRKPTRTTTRPASRGPSSMQFVCAGCSQQFTHTSVRSQPGKRERADFFATPATRNGAARAHPRNLKQAALPVRAARCRSHLLRQQGHRRNQASGHTILLQSHAAVASGLPSFLSCCRLPSLSRRLRSPSLDGKHFGADTMYPPTTRFIRYLLTIRACLLPYGGRYDWLHHARHQ